MIRGQRSTGVSGKGYLFVFEQVLERWLHLGGPQLVTLLGQVDMIGNVEIFNFMGERCFKENGQIQPVDALVIGESLNQLVHFMDFSVELNGGTGKNRNDQNLGVRHTLMEILKNGVDTLGNVLGAVFVRNVVGS